jgi:GNAT superfamily N-acetyltransferase
VAGAADVGASLPRVRPASSQDAVEVVRLAEQMFAPLVGDALTHDAWQGWRHAAVGAVRRRLGDEDVAVFVADDPRRPGGLVSCGAGVIARRLPSPWQVEGLVGYVQWMSTDPAYRRQGKARAVLRALLAWFEWRGVDDVELHATTVGSALYRSEGFWEGASGLALRRRPWDPPPQEAPAG